MSMETGPGVSRDAGHPGDFRPKSERSQDLTELTVNGAEFADVAGPLLESLYLLWSHRHADHTIAD